MLTVEVYNVDVISQDEAVVTVHVFDGTELKQTVDLSFDPLDLIGANDPLGIIGKAVRNVVAAQQELSPLIGARFDILHRAVAEKVLDD